MKTIYLKTKDIQSIFHVSPHTARKLMAGMGAERLFDHGHRRVDLHAVYDKLDELDLDDERIRLAARYGVVTFGGIEACNRSVPEYRVIKIAQAAGLLTNSFTVGNTQEEWPADLIPRCALYDSTDETAGVVAPMRERFPERFLRCDMTTTDEEIRAFIRGCDERANNE